MPSLSYAFPSASLAHSCPVLLDICVRWIVRVSLRAMSFLFLDLSEPQSQLTPSAIFSVSDRFKVFWINAIMGATKMVKFQSNRYFADHKFVSIPVDTNTFPLSVLNIKRTIARLKASACPNPTTIFSILINLVPKSPFNIHKTIIPRITTEVKAGYMEHLSH